MRGMPRPAANHRDSALHPAYLRLLVAVLVRHGVSIEALLRAANLPPMAVDGEALISNNSLERLINAALAATGRPWLGLELGAAAQVMSHGPLGLAAAASGTVRQALALAVRYVGLRSPWLSLELTDTGTELLLDLQPAPELRNSRRFLLEAALVMLEQVIIALSAQQCDAIEIALPWPAPDWSRHYGSFLRGRCHFGATGDRARLRIPARLADAAVLSADPAALAYARAECQRRMAEGADARALLATIQRQFASCSGQYPDAATMARTLGLSLRSFHRQLAAEGTRWQTLLDTARRDRACALLTETRRTIADIAVELGFAEPSNFSRVFRRWLGQSPGDYRATGGSRLTAGHDERQI